MNPHGIQRSKLEYLVFAGNYREFNQWTQENNIPDGAALFVASPSNVLGINTENLFHVIVGTFHLRADANEIMEAARSRAPQAIFLRAPSSIS